MFKISKKITLNTVFLLLFVYFGYHTVYGGRGLIAYFQLEKKLVDSSLKLSEVVAEKAMLQHYVNLLKKGDKDFIDEQARKFLGVADKNEQVFIYNEK